MGQKDSTTALGICLQEVGAQELGLHNTQLEAS